MTESLGRIGAATTSSTMTSPSAGASRRRHRRITAAAATGLVALSAVAGLGAPASAALSRTGAIDPATLFPSSYTDSNGLTLGLCLVDGLCLSGPDFVDIHKRGGDAEAFYYAADAEVGPITVHNALEAAYATVGNGQEVTFMRTQVSAQTGGLVPDAEYTITDPYGVLTCTANNKGQIRNNACRTETTPIPQDFATALGGRIGPFLMWDTFADPSLGAPPPAGYIGDNLTPHRVTGSPTGFNKVRVEGPGIGGTCTDADGTTVSKCDETDLFVIQGKVQPGASAALSATSWDFGNVPATPAATKSFTFANTSTDGTSVNLTGVTSTGSTDFGVGGSCTTLAALAPGATCTVDVSYAPTGGPATDTATVTIKSDLGDRSIAVSGRSVGDPRVATPLLTFAPQGLNSTSLQQHVVIENNGVAASTLTDVKLAGATPQHFTWDSTGPCFTTPIEPGTGCELAVAFAPTTAGDKTATLQLFFDGATTNPLTATLTGTGVVTAPGQPSAVAATAGDASATITWDAPVNDGGAAVSGYEVTVRNAAGTVVKPATPASSPYTVTGLRNGTTYTLEVRARNQTGLSDAATAEVLPVDRTKPTVTAANPAARATGVSRTANLKVTFSEAITGAPTATGRAATVRLRNTATGANVAAAVSFKAGTRVLTINPTASLAARTQYTVELTKGLKDQAGNALTGMSWTFKTGRS